jgi:hypothetical protein
MKRFYFKVRQLDSDFWENATAIGESYAQALYQLLQDYKRKFHRKLNPDTDIRYCVSESAE